MIYKCEVKGCPGNPDHTVSVGNMKFAVCSKHHEAMFELGREFADEFNNLGRRYFRLALNLEEKS